MKVRLSWQLLVALGGCATAGNGALPLSVQGAAGRYPPMILGANVHATDGHERPLSCAAPGAKLVQQGGSTIVFGGADPSDPDLCLMQADGQPAKAWYDIWQTDWPGAAQAAPLLRQVIDGPSGTVTGFENHVAPGRQYYDLMRNEGIEDIPLLGQTYHALKISHYREGFGDNGYRSVSTVWKDIPTGMLIYGTYQHIAGAPEIDDPILPTAIVPAR